jgi:hypothetical protein
MSEADCVAFHQSWLTVRRQIDSIVDSKINAGRRWARGASELAWPARSNVTADATVWRRVSLLGAAAERLVTLRETESLERTCPACGYGNLPRRPYLAYEGLARHRRRVFPPYALHFGDPSFDQCPSCGYEFGVTDHPNADGDAMTFAEWRQQWRMQGCPWSGDGKAPKGWDALRQLTEAGIGARTDASWIDS